MKLKKILLALSATVFISSCFAVDNHVQVEFITDPCLIPTKDNKFKLCDNMIIRIDNTYHAVPHGFKTDLASTPRIMWPLFSPSDYDSIAPAVLHDWHYCCVAQIDRKKADDIFYYGLLFHGMSKKKAYVYYVGVRALGWLYYQHGEGMREHEGEFEPSELQGIYDDVNA